MMKGSSGSVAGGPGSNDLPPAVRALIVAGLGVSAALALYLTRASPQGRSPADRRQSLIAYLREHLTGSDVAIHVVRRLRRTHEGTPEGRLFAYLAEEFEEDRAVVRSLLAHLGASAGSAKRLVGQASGALLSVVAGGQPGALSLLRTLEGLAIGVQGKRCMWRALESAAGASRLPGGKSFGALEMNAVRQWEAIEQHRQALAARTFPALDAPPRRPRV
jgi:hypothetical protein